MHILYLNIVIFCLQRSLKLPQYSFLVDPNRFKWIILLYRPFPHANKELSTPLWGALSLRMSQVATIILILNGPVAYCCAAFMFYFNYLLHLQVSFLVGKSLTSNNTEAKKSLISVLSLSTNNKFIECQNGDFRKALSSSQNLITNANITLLMFVICFSL